MSWFWIALALLVLLAGEAALRATWLTLGLVALGALVLAFVGRRRISASIATQLGLLILAALSAVAAARMGHLVYHAHALQREAIDGATRQRNQVLDDALRAARAVDQVALARAATGRTSATPVLNDLLGRTGLESAVALVNGDGVIAAAGPHRMQPIMRPGAAAVVMSPFAILLVVRASERGIQAQTVLLLDSLPGLPVAGPSLAARVSRWGVHWSWTPRSSGVVEYPDLAAAESGVIALMHPVPPAVTFFVAREGRVARQLVSVGLVILGLLIAFTARGPAVRAGAVLLPLWALARSDVGSTPFGLVVIRSLLVAIALVLLAVVAWRRVLPRRHLASLIGAFAALAVGPLLVAASSHLAGSDARPFSLAAGFAWTTVIGLAATGYFAIAASPLLTAHDRDARSVWGIASAVAAMLAGLVGVVAWSPDRWPTWYPFLWLLPILLALPATTRTARLVALAATGCTLAALSTWSLTLHQRMAQATSDLARLDAVADPSTVLALDHLADSARAMHATRLDRLFAAWERSPLAKEDVPSYLALWSSTGHQREVVALDSVSVGWYELAPLVAAANGATQQIGLRQGVGYHQVLILPLAPDTVATVTIGPRSRLLSPTTFGLLVDWRAFNEAPPYRVDIAPDSLLPSDGRFRRAHRFVMADRVVTAGDLPREVRATVEMLTPQPFLVRAALAVLIDVLLALGLWIVLDRMLGRPPEARAPVFRRSYRRTVTGALMAFLIVPAALFTASSLVRLRQDAQEGHAAELSSAVRDVAVAGGLAAAFTPVPSNDSLAFIADSANAVVAIYRHGSLLAASDPLLAELGLLPPVIDRHTCIFASADPCAIKPPFPDAPLRLGAIDVSPPGTLLLAAIPGSDTALAQEQIDQSLRLLLAVLSGIIASVIVAGIIARALGRPIDALRRSAIAIGRREPPPEVRDVPAEFAPVFGAITQMEADLRTTLAELRAGRARTAAILSTVATGVIGVDARGDVMHINPRAAAIFDQPLAIGTALDQQLPPPWRHEIGEMRAALVRDPHRLERRELDVGDARFSVTLAALGDGGLVLAITDITEASRAARIVAWGEMARQVAHEIKNPLTPMRLGLQHLKRVETDRIADYPALVHQTAERLLLEIERLDRIARSFARYGTPPGSAEPLDDVAVGAVLGEVAALFALSGAEPVVTIAEAGGTVRARREELVQVLLNLLDNSRQAGASQVVIELHDATLRVTDDGRGIPPDQMARIFEPAFSTNTSGAGLGLAIVKRLVEGWGAVIVAESPAPDGRGASFAIRFPVNA